MIMPIFLVGLALIFITLKLLGVIAWGWWLVLMPIYPHVLAWIVVIALMAGAEYNLKKESKE